FNHAPAEGFADLVERVMPSVISVEVKFTNVVGGSDSHSFTFGDRPPGLDQLPENHPMRKFFEDNPGFRFEMPGRAPQRREMGQGSGFLVSADGYAVTNHHVVTNADEVRITTAGGKEFDAKVVGTDAKTDLALLKIESEGPFPFVKFAEKEARVGDWVIAVGNPFGLGGTVTTGVVSARGRDIGSGPYDDFLQIDAPINRGNSGGPAFNLKGEVVGVNTAIFSPSGGSVGIGFAIPAGMAADIVENLRDNGKVTRGWLGIQIQPVTDDIAASLKLPSAKGALVADVTDKSPAAQAGIKTGDTVLRVNDQEVAQPKDLARKIALIAPGKDAVLTVIRDGKQQLLTVEVGTMPNDNQASEVPMQKDKPANLASLGFSVEPSSEGTGVSVTAVEPDSPADERGIKSGDTILEIDGKEIADVEAMNSRLAAAHAEGRDRVLMLIRSGERQRFVAIPVEKPKS
ncbi:MAG: Do family serine endopeptidase, partial [Dongiaceae bacterium]